MQILLASSPFVCYCVVMENKQLKRIEIWLRIIADELYVVRTDKEFEGASGSGPEIWEKQGRDYMIRGIENMREKLEKSE